MMNNKIYTKTGDKGKTGLIGGERIPKHHVLLEACGTIDELNTMLGLLRAKSKQAVYTTIILHIQKKLFSLAPVITTGKGKQLDEKHRIKQSDVTYLEQEIDRIADQIPLLENFIIPGSNELAAICHVARTVCRRAERRISFLTDKKKSDKINLIYINRLSDFLFILARKICFDSGEKEKVWI